MNRRNFLKLAGLGFLSPFVPLPKANMKLSDYLAKMAHGMPLSEAEISDMTNLADAQESAATLLKTYVRPGTQQLALRLPFEVIQSSVLEQDVASVTIAVPSIYRHLLMFIHGKTAYTTSYRDAICLRMNDDTGTNYQLGWVQSHAASTVDGQQADGLDYMNIGNFQTLQADLNANTAAGAIAFIPNYRSAFWKCVYTISGAQVYEIVTGTLYGNTQLKSGFWKSTSPIEKIKVYGFSGSNIKAGTLISLYGML